MNKKKQTIKDRIILNLKNGPRRYSELLEMEEDSIQGMKKWVEYQIKDMKENIQKPGFYQSNDDAKLVLACYEEFIKTEFNHDSMKILNMKLSQRDFSRSIRISFGSYLRELVKERLIIKVSRGLYLLSLDSEKRLKELGIIK
ncbi:MAG: hypothetical protein NUV97_00620 [archaeon]|nr:hypothetical protein [archaeon]